MSADPRREKLLAAGFAPFDDPRVKEAQRVESNANFKAFNAITGVLLKNLAMKFPAEPIILFFQKELTELSKSPTKWRIPASSFFTQVHVLTRYKNEQTGKPIPYVDLLIEKDPRAMEEPIPIAILNAIGLSKKFNSLPKKDQDIIWDYLIRMVKTCATAVTSNQRDSEAKNELGAAIMVAVAEGKKSPEEIITDSGVEQTARAVLDRIKQ